MKPNHMTNQERMLKLVAYGVLSFLNMLIMRGIDIHSPEQLGSKVKKYRVP